MSKEIVIIGSSTKSIEDILRPAYQSVTTAPPADLLRIARTPGKNPRVFVLDIRRQNGLPSGLALLKSEQASTGVVVVADRLDPQLMLETMRAGVNEWVAEPLTVHELLGAVERASGGANRVAGEVFAVVGAKGGVGTTTVAVNIATALSSGSRHQALIIDLHPACGDCALFLGVEPSFSLLDALDNTHKLDEAYLKGIVTKTQAGPDLLASPDRAFASAMEMRKVRAVVEAASRYYRYVILDVPRSDTSLDEVLGLASSITVVVTQEISAIRTGTRAAAALRQRHGSSRVKVVVNRYDIQAEIGAEDLEKAFGTQMGHRFPSNYRLAVDALNKGMPLVVQNHNKLAAAFSHYARSLSHATSHAEPKPATRNTGLLGRLTGRS